MTGTPVKEQIEVMEPSPIKDNTATTINAKTEHDKLEQLTLTKTKLTRLKEDLNKMIDAMTQNSSLFSRAATFWGELPLWQKISAGIILIVPFLVIGYSAMFLFTLITYTIGSLILDDHYDQNTNNTKNLRDGIASLANVLETVIVSLDTLREQLTNELAKFQKENTLLATSVDQLDKQIIKLTSQIKDLSETAQKLRSTQVILEDTTTNLKNSLQEQSKLLEEKQKELEQVIQDYKKNQTQLSDKVSELDEIKVTMGKEVKQARIVGLVLKSTVETLSKAVIADKEQDAVFQLRLNEFLTNKEKSFDQVTERICEAEHKLSLVTEQLEQSNQRCQELLERQDQQITRLEQIDKVQSTQIQKPQMSPATLLSKIGIHAVNEQNTRPLDHQFELLKTALAAH